MTVAETPPTPPGDCLPPAISGVNSWLRGYGDPPPQTLIVLGASRRQVDEAPADCEPDGRVSNP